MVTLKEIAQECGVSVATVSNILNGKPKVSEATRNRVMECVNRRGYQPNFFAQGMRKQKTKIIGIITEDINEFSTTPIVESMIAYCDDHGYRTLLTNMRMYDKWQDTWYNDDEKLQAALQPALTEMLSIKVDAIAYIAGHCRVVNNFPDNFPVPAISVYALSKSKKYNSVILDDEKGGYEMAKYLISKGHKNIGVICGARNNVHTQRRLFGIQQAMFDARLPMNPMAVCYGNWERESAKDWVDVLLKQGVSAIFAMCDYMAGGVYDVLREKGLEVGKDISVAGYDNRDISGFLYPQLTTYSLPYGEIGRKSSELLIHMIESKETACDPQVLKVPGELIIRDSVRQL